MDKSVIMPFLWIHGEDEKTYRQMVNVIHDCNIDAFCIEARPHEGFLKEKWWEDLDILLDEASKRHMKVWILDDKHFPTGYAAGALKNAPKTLRRRHIFHKSIKANEIHGSITSLIHFKEIGKIAYWNNWLAHQAEWTKWNDHKFETIGEDELLSITAYTRNSMIDLSEYIHDGMIHYKNEDVLSIEICGLTYNSGARRDYINMIDEASCKVLIDTVYEPHYAHYKHYFGNTIAGFFSDEPELGNGSCCVWNNVLGKNQTLPYSEALAQRLKEALGEKWKSLLPLLWKNDQDKTLTEKVRYIYMDNVTYLVSECFNHQISSWCHDHHIGYIGHVIEDNNQHARMGSSLGHYYRGLKYQSMAGIDDIGGQVYPCGEDRHEPNIFNFKEDGEFYHYSLGKLAASLASITPHMDHKAFCEIFGNYGWEEGVQLEKYLVDHFMIRGINHFVPHAFTSRNYPDPDCPPHFYASGHNPLYRHFGSLMTYTKRVCELINDKQIIHVAILYHGESEWCGSTMMMQKIARKCYDNHIDYHFIPADVFLDKDFYHTDLSHGLSINGTIYNELIIGECEYLPEPILEGLNECPCDISFINKLPKNCNLKNVNSITLKGISSYLDKYKIMKTNPASKRLRIAEYEHFYYLFNEDDKCFNGYVTLNKQNDYVYYDAYEDKAYEPVLKGRQYYIELDPSKSLFIMKRDKKMIVHKNIVLGDHIELKHFTRSITDNIHYPDFKDYEAISLSDEYDKIDPSFSGIIRYETELEGNEYHYLIIEEAYDGCEVFVNGRSLGIQVVPSFRYDMKTYLHKGLNQITIEISTTLNNERNEKKVKNGLYSTVKCYKVKGVL